MRNMLRNLFVVGLALSLFGCLTVSPLDKIITLEDGQIQIFTASSDIKTAEVVWTLDGQQVASGGSYSFVAVSTDVEQSHTLTVKEQGGNPLLRHDTISWTIIVEVAGSPDKDRDGYTVEAGDCNDDDATINPGAQEICGNDVDENCDNVICQNEVPIPPANVRATDLDSGRTDIQITWDASPGAQYYVVQRSTWVDDAGRYKQVGQSNGTSFEYVQNFETDLYAKVGPNPTLPMDPTDTEKKAFLPVLNNYRLQMVEPVLFDFKAPAFFKVQACNANGCSELSAADKGQANFIHTPQNSEIAPMVIMIWGEPMLRVLADVPSGTAGANYCGVDFCGYEGYGGPGGLIMGRVVADVLAGEVDFDTYYEDYVMGSDYFPYPDSIAISNGRLSGHMTLLEGNAGTYRVGGDDFTMNLYGIEVTFASYMYFGGGSGNANDGYVNVTWNGVTAQYSMPILPAAVQDPSIGYLQAIKPTANNPQRTDTFEWLPSTAAYPSPFSETNKPKPTCGHNSGARGVVDMCYTN